MLSLLSLTNFRSYRKNDFHFGESTIIIGHNASGKTNILEAIYCLATGKAFRASNEKEVVKEGDKNSLEFGEVTRIFGVSNDDELEVIWDARARLQKLYRVNGSGKRQNDFVGLFLAVLFQPTDLDIIIGSPGKRREYLDGVLSLAHKDYRVALSIYEKALRQRNRLLWRVKHEEARVFDIKEQLNYWDKLLIDKGEIIHNYRKGLVEFINESEHVFAIKLDYDHSIISDERLDKYRQQEIAVGATLVGPQRDDLLIKIKDHKLRLNDSEPELRSFGSRGQQRMGTLVFKMAELDYLEEQTGQRPTLLLDDIFSELDESNRRHVFSLVPRQQTIITTSDFHQNEQKLLSQCQVIKVGN